MTLSKIPSYLHGARVAVSSFTGLSASLAFVAGLLVLVNPSATAQDNEKELLGAGKWAWKAFDPKTVFYQELEISTTEDMKVRAKQGSQKQRQTFYLKWTAEDKKDGNYVVSQEIIGLKMDINIGGNAFVYDSTEKKQPQNPMANIFGALLGLKRKLTISPKMEIVHMEGLEQFIKKVGAANPQMQPLLKKILRDDAVPQMAELTWGALPGGEPARGARWISSQKPSVLDFGPLGTATPMLTYTYAGNDDKGREKISIKADLTYDRPDMKNGQPFAIKEAVLSSKEGVGAATFDPAKGRFALTTMKMKLEGEWTIEVGGMVTKLFLVQTQEARSTTSAEPPPALKKKQ